MSAARVIVSTMGLAWAMPVKPNELVVQLQKYEKALASMEELGLGHHFGEGNDAHIMHLPENVVTLIEDFVLHCTSIPGGERNPDFTFRCFENKCIPVDHRDGDDDEILATIADDMAKKVCNVCKKSVNDTFSPKCKSNCKEKYDQGVNDEFSADESFWEGDRDAREYWEETIDQGPQGDFVKFDQLLLKHFGLKAHFATTRASEENEEMWPDNPNLHWHDHVYPVQTTTCYLIIPNRSSSSNIYHALPMEMEDRPDDKIAHIQVGQAYFVDSLDLGQREKHVQQFERVMRVLQIKPYIHSSQLAEQLSAEVDVKDTAHETAVEETVKGGRSSKKKRKAEEAPKKAVPKVLDATSIEWPQLTMLLKASAQFRSKEQTHGYMY